jgi:hypothetical protein
MRLSLGREPGTDAVEKRLIRSCRYRSVESKSTRLSDSPVRAAAASGSGDLPSQFMQFKWRADPLPRSESVDLPASLLAHLHELMLSIGEDEQDLDDALVALATALHSTATSYCGLQLTIFENEWLVTLTAFVDGHDADGHDVPVGTSLRLPLALVWPMVDSQSGVVFFAVTPGAFTDLAADLSYALGRIPVEHASQAADGVDHRDHGGARLDGHRRSIELDADLPPPSRVSGLTGLAELTVINRAVGMLVAQGHDIEPAHHVLRREAAAAGVEPHIYATWILRR